jgi:hypothetical protein
MRFAVPEQLPAHDCGSLQKAIDATLDAANEFSTETEAKTRCPTDTVVWGTLSSNIYHFTGTRYYGNTKHGAYMCGSGESRRT